MVHNVSNYLGNDMEEGRLNQCLISMTAKSYKGWFYPAMGKDIQDRDLYLSLLAMAWNFDQS